MRLIDEEYTRHRFYGSPRMTTTLQQQGYAINHKRIERLMQTMGLQAIAPAPSTSQSREAHRGYPYLLGGVSIDHPFQVWSAEMV
jgi:putative transposase